MFNIVFSILHCCAFISCSILYNIVQTLLLKIVKLNFNSRLTCVYRILTDFFSGESLMRVDGSDSVKHFWVL